MRRFILSLLGCVLLSTFAAQVQVQALPLPTGERESVYLPQDFTANYNFEGIVQLSNCSGSLIRLEGSKDSDLALVLSNGHCYEGGFIQPGKFLINVRSTRKFGLMDAAGKTVANLRATSVIYATMTKTDITLYQLSETYAQILAQYNIRPLTLASQHAEVGQEIEVISGYWKRGYSCAVEAFVHNLKEGNWMWEDSMRYSRPGCEVIGGTSGSPVIAKNTRTVIAVNNTGNENGDRCTVNNPCEIDANGNVFYEKGYSYAEQTNLLYSCLDANNVFNFTQTGCLLPH
jgi:V8-like Glu-specific endopeptidase